MKIFSDQLFAGRFLSVIFGALQVAIMPKLMSLFTKNKKLQLLAALLAIFTPGLILTGRLAIIDTQLTFFLSASFYFSFRALEKIFATKITTNKDFLFHLFNRPLFLASLFFALALFTKFSAILFIPVLVTLIFYFWSAPKINKLSKKIWLQIYKIILLATPLILIAFFAGCLFLLLKLHPAFSQLFSRGGDFLYSWTDFWQQPLSIIYQNLFFVQEVLSAYLTNILFFSAIVLAICFWRRDRRPLLLLISGCAFITPIILFGQVLYPRYLLPALPFFLCSFALSLTHFYFRFAKQTRIILLALFFLTGGYFTYCSIFAPAKMLLPEDDITQYLVEWSSGYGITETVAYLEELKTAAPTLVLTEGYFGTLPDALLVYFFNRNVDNLRIEGIGQPVSNLDKADPQLLASYDQIVLVVNSHRMFLDLPADKLLKEFTRPLPDSPSLQIWNLK